MDVSGSEQDVTQAEEGHSVVAPACWGIEETRYLPGQGDRDRESIGGRSAMALRDPEQVSMQARIRPSLAG
jgi:hypothetical protein